MYEAILLGVFVLSGVCTGQGVTCPDEDPTNTTVMLPNPQNCTKFFMCHHGQAVPMSCSWGTYFNANKSVCDWPADSGCVQPDTPTVCNPADLVPLYPVPGNCSAFIACSGDQQFKMACPAGLHFSPSLKVCVWPKDSTCVQPTSTPAPESSTASFNEATVTAFEATTQLPSSDSTTADNVC